MPAPGRRYLLDTNVLSDVVRRPLGRAATRLTRVGDDTVCTRGIVAAEIRFGALKARSARLKKQVEAVLAAIEVLPLEAPADQHYARIRARLERRGELIGPNDLLIAAHALAAGCVLVTANQREFWRVPGLRIENWLDG